jgi:Tol biopolymer transport system component
MFALSPDQKQIAYATQVPSLGSGQVFLRNLDGGETRALLKTEGLRGGGALIWSDADAILIHRPSTRPLGDFLVRVPVDGSAPSDVTFTGVIGRIALHPDGRRLVWEADTLGQELSVIEGLLAQ